MPLAYLKRTVRRYTRRATNWTTIAKLTLSGNKVGRNTRLRNCKSPVLMIYGFGATRRTLAILENRLRKDGYVTFSLNLGGFIGTFNTISIEESARNIAKQVEVAYKKYRIKGKMSVIGHSKGGLIGQYYIKYLGGDKRVSTFVTIGTPHNGTPWATLAAYTAVGYICQSLKQMVPESKFLKKLKEKKFPKQIKVYSIYSKSDTVSPFPTSVLTDEGNNVKNIEVSGVTHSELLIKKSVFNAIKHALHDQVPQSWYEASKQSYEEHLIGKKAKLKVVK